MSDRCITCGSPVRIESSGEGTNYYVPITDEERAKLIRGLQAIVDYGDDEGETGLPVNDYDEKYPEFIGMEAHEIARNILDEIDKKD